MKALYPPMGWNSWDCYGTAVNEETVRKNADYMAKYLKPLGWEYVVVDIQWYQPTAATHAYEAFAPLCMDGFGRLLPAENRFPSAKGGAGFGPLAAYVHSLGLKFGIHIMRGLPRQAAQARLPVLGTEVTCGEIADPHSICAWNPDMYGLRQTHPDAQAYYDSLFALYAEWGVDFVKCDDIAREYPHCRREIELISAACASCGREIVLSLSPGPAPVEEAGHLKRWANMWRITDDFWDEWRLLRGMFERAEKWCIHAGPGHWPDADMLPVAALRQNDDPPGWTRFTHAEQRTMMTLWCIMRSPMMIGSELTKLDDFTLALLTNEGVLAMLKESWCARPLFTTETAAAWIAPRQDGKGVYAALFNLSEEDALLTLPLKEYGVPGMHARELWTDAESDGDTLSAALAPHDAAVWLITEG